MRKLAWTIVIALVFSAGLIAGQRLMRRDRVKPLVSVSNQTPPGSHDDAVDRSNGEAQSPAPVDDISGTFFSFYERLSNGAADTPDREPQPAEQANSPAELSAEAAAGDKSEAREDDAADQAAKYTLQVSAHPDRSGAKSEMKKLEGMGLDPYLMVAEIPDKGKYYRVRIGKFRSMDAARQFKDELERRRDLETYVNPL